MTLVVVVVVAVFDCLEVLRSMTQLTMGVSEIVMQMMWQWHGIRPRRCLHRQCVVMRCIDCEPSDVEHCSRVLCQCRWSHGYRSEVLDACACHCPPSWQQPVYRRVPVWSEATGASGGGGVGLLVDLIECG
jgi:hypothetical protein